MLRNEHAAPELLHLCNAADATADKRGLLSRSPLHIVHHVGAPHMAARTVRDNSALADLNEDCARGRCYTNLVSLGSESRGCLRRAGCREDIADTESR